MLNSMRTPVLLAATLAALALSSTARADDAAACNDAFEQSQLRRDEGKLLEARKLMRACGRPTCSATRQKLCGEWLKDVESRVPTVVLSAKDASGADVVDVSVMMDGVPLAASLDGREIDVDPGPHTFVFQRADGSKVETKAVAVERGKGKVVAVAFGQAAAPTPPAAPTPAPGTQAPPPPVAPAPAPAPAAPEASGGSTWKTVGWVLGGAGVVGLGVGTIFGVVAINDNSAAHCNAANQCLAGPLGSARGAAAASDVGFIAGGVLLAGGAALVLFGPSGGSEKPAPTAAITPVVGPAGGGLALGGTW
jgi:hypothetical protein